MQLMIQVFKETLMPGSMQFLVIGLAAGVLLLYRHAGSERWGRRWLAVLVASYWFLSIPLGADAVVSVLSYGFKPVATPADARGATAVVVLDGGSFRFGTPTNGITVVNRASALRTLEAVRIYRMLDHPWMIVTAGGHDQGEWATPEGGAVREELIKAGVPEHLIVLDTKSRNTREHAVNIAQLLRQHGVRQFVLVTSPMHIRRAVLVFQSQGLQPIPSAPSVWFDGSHWRWAKLLPGGDVLQISGEGLYDGMGLLYYWSRGWLSASS